MKYKIFLLILIGILVTLGIQYYNTNVGPSKNPCGDNVVGHSKSFDKNDRVGYIYNVNCPSSACNLIRNGKEIPIAPFQSLQTGDQIIVYKTGYWIQLMLNNNPNPITVTPAQSPYTICFSI